MNKTRRFISLTVAVLALSASAATAAVTVVKPTPTPTPVLPLPVLTGVSATWQHMDGFIVTWAPLDSKYSSRVTGYTVTASNGAVCKVSGYLNNECHWSTSTVPFPFKPYIPYTFTVTANGSEGAGPISAVSNTAYWYGAPSYSTFVYGTTISDTQIDVNWVPDPRTGGVPLTGFKVFYWPLNKDNLQKVVTSTTYTASLTGLTPSTWYVIALTSCNYYGCSASDWIYKATSPYTLAVTSTKLPLSINGGSASTTCFDRIIDGGGVSSTGATVTKAATPCPKPTPPAKPWAVVDPTATKNPNGPIATKFNQSAYFRFDPGYSLKLSYGYDQGLSRFTFSRSYGPRIYTSTTPKVCSIVLGNNGWAAHFLSVGTCTISMSIPEDETYKAAGPFVSSMQVTA